MKSETIKGEKVNLSEEQLLKQRNESYEKYLTENIIIGMTESFPEIESIDTRTVEDSCRRYNVLFNVRLSKVGFGNNENENDKYWCYAIVTDRVDIANKLVAGGFGSHCYADEAATMEKAVVAMAKEHGLTISSKINSWPFAKAIVTKLIPEAELEKRKREAIESKRRLEKEYRDNCYPYALGRRA